MTQQQIDNTFTYHAPFGTQVQRYQDLREAAKSFAVKIQEAFPESREKSQEAFPESREKSLALTSLQQTMMWANASIAINEKQ